MLDWYGAGVSETRVHPKLRSKIKNLSCCVRCRVYSKSALNFSFFCSCFVLCGHRFCFQKFIFYLDNLSCFYLTSMTKAAGSQGKFWVSSEFLILYGLSLQCEVFLTNMDSQFVFVYIQQCYYINKCQPLFMPIFVYFRLHSG